MSQAEKGNWDDFEKEKPGNNNNDGNTERRKIEYMKFDKPGDYTIRLVGNHVKFLRHWDPFERKDRVITDASYKGKDPAWNAGFYPRKTYAIHIIDRADGVLKILEKGTQIFKEFAHFKSVNDINPAGKEGPNFVITVEIPGGNKRSTRYSVMAKQGAAPFTEEEIAMVKANIYPLADIYKSTDLEKIKELWAAIPEDRKIPPKREYDDQKSESSSASAPAPKSQDEPPAENIEDAPADEEDLFADEPVAEGAGNSAEIF